MKTSHTITAVLLLCALAGTTITGHAATAILQTTVTRVLTDSVNYGGCMAALAVSPTTKLPGCAANWVSFSCTGSFADKALAFEAFDNAKLAMAMNKTIQVIFDDAKKHNGFCFAQRLDVSK